MLRTPTSHGERYARRLALRFRLKLQLWVANVVNMWLCHVAVNVVSSCGCEVVKEMSPRIDSRHVVTRHGHRKSVGAEKSKSRTNEQKFES